PQRKCRFCRRGGKVRRYTSAPLGDPEWDMSRRSQRPRSRPMTDVGTPRCSTWEGARMKVIRSNRALVTGAGWGIGRAVGLALAREGADLCLLDINENSLANVALEARDLGVRVRTVICDLAYPAAAGSAADELLQAWGGLEILIHNAGLSYHGNTEAMSDEQWDRVLAVNLHSPLQLTRRLLPALLSSGDAHIVNVCSILGLVAIPRFAAYQTSKYGLVGFSESLRAEYASRGLG